MLAPPLCSTRLQHGLSCALSQPPNIYYSLEVIIFVKIVRICTIIYKKFVILTKQLYLQRNFVAPLTFVDLFHAPYQIRGILPPLLET